MSEAEALQLYIERLEAYENDHLLIKKSVLQSGLIGADGILIKLHNDPSASVEVRQAASRTAGTLAKLRNARITVQTAIKRLRVELQLLGAIEQDNPTKPVDPNDDEDIKSSALDCLTLQQKKIVVFLLTRKHTTTADTLKSVDGAFRYGDQSEDRAVTFAMEQINKRWLENGIAWAIRVQDAKGSPRFKLEK